MEENLNVGQPEVASENLNIEEVANDMTGEVYEGGFEDATEETPVQTEEPVEEPSEDDVDFAPDEIDFEESKFNIEGYNLDKYKDTLEFDNDESLGYINAEMQKLKSLGYTQKEAEIYIDAKLETAEEYEAEKPYVPTTKTDVMKLLNESLNREEKANYKPILGWTKEVGQQIGLSPQQVNEAMSNPTLVKLMNGFYKKAVSSGGIKTNEVKAPESKMSLDYGSAMKAVQDKISNDMPKDQVIKYAQNLENSLKGEELEKYQQTYKRVFGLN
ncbi:MAG: hypothetical protein ACRCZ9_03075 [Fusobacteriaceae bacterium]